MTDIFDPYEVLTAEDLGKEFTVLSEEEAEEQRRQNEEANRAAASTPEYKDAAERVAALGGGPAADPAIVPADEAEALIRANQEANRRAEETPEYRAAAERVKEMEKAGITSTWMRPDGTPTGDAMPEVAAARREKQDMRFMDAITALGEAQANLYADGSASGRGLEAIAGIDGEQKKLNRWIMSQLPKYRPQSRQWYALHRMMEETNETFDQQKRMIRQDMEKGSGKSTTSMIEILRQQRELQSLAPGLADQIATEAGLPPGIFEVPEETQAPDPGDAFADFDFRSGVYNNLKQTYNVELQSGGVLTPAIMANADITSAIVLYLETGNFSPISSAVRNHVNDLEKAVEEGLAPAGVTAANIPAIKDALENWLVQNIMRANHQADVWVGGN